MKKYFSILFVASAMMAMGCEKTQPDNDNDTDNLDYDVISVDMMSFDEVFEELAGCRISDVEGNNGGDEDELDLVALLMARRSSTENLLATDPDENGMYSNVANFFVKTYSIRYPSVDAEGNKIYLYGRVHLPMKKPLLHDAKNLPVTDIVLHTHATAQSDNPFSLGNKKLLDKVLSLKSLTEDGMVVLEPFYQGWTIDMDKTDEPVLSEPQSYLAQKLIAKHCIDMVAPALHLIDSVITDESCKLPAGYGTYVTGYSQGGGNAMAIGYYLDKMATEKERKLLNVKKIFCGAGPYNPYGMYEKWFATDSLCMSVVLPMVIKGQMIGHPDIMKGIDMLDYFSQLYLDTGVPRYFKEGTGKEGNLMVDRDLAEIRWDPNSSDLLPWVKLSKIMSDKVTEKDSKILAALVKCFEMECVYDWTPDYPVQIFSSEYDNVIPHYENAVVAYNTIKENIRKNNSKGQVGIIIPRKMKLDHISGDVSWLFKEVLVNETYKTKGVIEDAI